MLDASAHACGLALEAIENMPNSIPPDDSGLPESNRARRAVHHLCVALGLDGGETDAILDAAGLPRGRSDDGAENSRLFPAYLEQDTERLADAIRQPVALEEMTRATCAGQPPVDALFEIRLRSGRRVGISDLRFEGAYAGLIDGDPDKFARRYRERWVESVREAWGERKTLVLEPVLVPLARRPGARLPRVACAAWLDSAPVDPEFMGSSLVLIWWQERLAGALPHAIQRLVRDVDWDRVAENYDL